MKDKNDPIFSENWLTWDGKQLVRSVPNIQSPLHKMKPEDQEALKNGNYMCVSRFDKPVVKCDNPQAQLSKTKTAVMVKANTFTVVLNPSVLTNVITVGN